MNSKKIHLQYGFILFEQLLLLPSVLLLLSLTHYFIFFLFKSIAVIHDNESLRHRAIIAQYHFVSALQSPTKHNILADTFEDQRYCFKTADDHFCWQLNRVQGPHKMPSLYYKNGTQAAMEVIEQIKQFRILAGMGKPGDKKVQFFTTAPQNYPTLQSKLLKIQLDLGSLHAHQTKDNEFPLILYIALI